VSVVWTEAPPSTPVAVSKYWPYSSAATD